MSATPSTPEYADYEVIGPAWIGKPTHHHLFESKKYVLIFGWLDAQFKYVEKYAQSYRSKGYTAIVQIGTSHDFDVVWNDRKQFDEFDPLIDYLNQNNLLEATGTTAHSSHPKVVLHSFSNGGMFKIYRLVNALHAKGHQLKSHGLILDSSPGKPTAVSWAGFIASMTQNSILKPVAFAGGFLVACFLMVIYDMKKHPISLGIPYITSVKNENGNVFGPRLFLYSQADDVIQFADVKDHVETTRKEGIVAEEMMFTTSPHVKHAVDFKEEYWKAVESFLEKHK
ncbi:UNVERIFIED_CONTAM: hypothetical protein HDU68_012596 [Siphonaria sp. JEL0065]|nr:hypothetical protein HDU68_012596 [Siphonaria sp. JEL0065]